MFIPLKTLGLGMLEGKNCFNSFSLYRFDYSKVKAGVGFV